MSQLHTQSPKRFVALADAMAVKHYGLDANEFNVDEETALQHIQEGRSVIDVLNADADAFDLDRLDSDSFVPSQRPLTEEDLQTADKELSADIQ
ncbi:hypothetical protein [Pseudomonas serbica]|uniref:hypothetical protein n=1 Tax=Pseudomonas serbica TaxID=2965074 RepID=UPI00237C4B7F|nr:hypothetical protein [Pseudomonas serbica]